MNHPTHVLAWVNFGADPDKPHGVHHEYFHDEAAARVRQEAVDPGGAKSNLRPFLAERDKAHWEATR